MGKTTNGQPFVWSEGIWRQEEAESVAVKAEAFMPGMKFWAEKQTTSWEKVA